MDLTFSSSASLNGGYVGFRSLFSIKIDADWRLAKDFLWAASMGAIAGGIVEVFLRICIGRWLDDVFEPWMENVIIPRLQYVFPNAPDPPRLPEEILSWSSEHIDIPEIS